MATEMTQPGLASFLTTELGKAWERRDAGETQAPSIPTRVRDAVEQIVQSGSAPTRQILIAIAVGTACDPDSNPGSLQLAAGVDRRGQALTLVSPLSEFLLDHSLALKISKDPGVSNPFREEEITEEWVRRRGSGGIWQALLDVVDWLKAENGDDTRLERALDLTAVALDALVMHSLSNALVYPRFLTSAPIAMGLVFDFLSRVGYDPDAIEAIATAAVRVTTAQLAEDLSVERGDTNAPDPIDVLILNDGGEAKGGVEVTKDRITVAKLQHEVLPAMQLHGLNRATVICAPPTEADRDDVQQFIESTATHLGQHIELRRVEDIESWLTMPGLSPDTGSRFLVEIGEELDRYSADASRHHWLATLKEFIARSTAL